MILADKNGTFIFGEVIRETDEFIEFLECNDLMTLIQIDRNDESRKVFADYDDACDFAVGEMRENQHNLMMWRFIVLWCLAVLVAGGFIFYAWS